MTEPVIKIIEVACNAETAFGVFARDFAKWWPKDKHSVSAMGGLAARSVRLEPRVGGVIEELGADGVVHVWGSVKTYDPPRQLSLLWHIGTPLEQATIVDVVFVENGARTTVTLTHHNWEAMGEAAAQMREGYDKGWVHVFETCFAAACAAA